MKEKVLNFAKITHVPPLGDLTALQWESFNEFYQFDVPPEKREKKGLQALFEESSRLKIYTNATSWSLSGTILANPDILLKRHVLKVSHMVYH